MNSTTDNAEALISGILDAVVSPTTTVLTVQEAALALRVSDSTVLGLIRTNRLGNIPIHKKSYRIPRQALYDHLLHRYVAVQLTTATQELALLQLELKRRKAELRRVTQRIAQASDTPTT